ncbi:MAG: hypothetical protein RL701_8023 [Pseudomonadota bacterium]
MKFRPRTFKIQWDLHAWSGVIASLFLFVIFYCGMFALFNKQLAQWQDPALHQRADEPVAAASFGALLEAVQKKQAIPRGAQLEIWQTGARISHEATKLDQEIDLTESATQKKSSEYSRLAEELYVMHFFYRVPLGIEFAGFVAIAFFIAIMSGVVIHLKDLARQLWQFRPDLRVRFSTSDAHKVLGVFGLPFAMMYAWSGALLGLYNVLAAPLVYGVYNGDQAALERAASGLGVPIKPSDKPATMLPVDELVQRAVATLRPRLASDKVLKPSSVRVDAYGDENAALTVHFEPTGVLEGEQGVQLQAATGRVLRVLGMPSAPSERMNKVLFGLHYASFGGELVRILYALLALAVCAVILTGNVIWLERRDPKRAHAGNRWLERLTVGFSFGLVLGSACYFAANRALPRGLQHRADIEYGLFLATWGMSALLVISRLGSARRWASELSRAAALTFALVVISDLATQRAHLLSALRLGLPNVWLVELLLASLALSFALLARLFRSRLRPQPASDHSLAKQ